MKSGRKDHKNRLLRAGESKTKKVDTVIHIMKMGNRNHFTVGNWSRQTSFRQRRRNVYHYENRMIS